MPSIHFHNPFKSRHKAPSAASLHKFCSAPQQPAVATKPLPRPKSGDVRGKAKGLLNKLVKPSASPRVAEAQQNVIQAVTSAQPLAGNAGYRASMQTLASSSGASNAALPPLQDDPSTQQHPFAIPQLVIPSDLDPLTEAQYQTALQGPDAYAAYQGADALSPAIAAQQPLLGTEQIYADALNEPDPKVYEDYADLQRYTRQSMEQVPEAAQSPVVTAALAQQEAQVKQAMTRLMDDMHAKHQTVKEVKLADGSSVTARFILDKSDNKTRIFTIEDEVGFESRGQYGESVSLREGNLRLNRLEPADHWRTSNALGDALANASLLLKA